MWKGWRLAIIAYSGWCWSPAMKDLRELWCWAKRKQCTRLQTIYTFALLLANVWVTISPKVPAFRTVGLLVEGRGLRFCLLISCWTGVQLDKVNDGVPVRLVSLCWLPKQSHLEWRVCKYYKIACLLWIWFQRWMNEIQLSSRGTRCRVGRVAALSLVTCIAVCVCAKHQMSSVSLRQL